MEAPNTLPELDSKSNDLFWIIDRIREMEGASLEITKYSLRIKISRLSDYKDSMVHVESLWDWTSIRPKYFKDEFNMILDQMERTIEKVRSLNTARSPDCHRINMTCDGKIQMSASNGCSL